MIHLWFLIRKDANTYIQAHKHSPHCGPPDETEKKEQIWIFWNKIQMKGHSCQPSDGWQFRRSLFVAYWIHFMKIITFKPHLTSFCVLGQSKHLTPQNKNDFHAKYTHNTVWSFWFRFLPLYSSGIFVVVMCTAWTLQVSYGHWAMSRDCHVIVWNRLCVLCIFWWFFFSLSIHSLKH